jgi:hypothetical protein
MKTITNAELQTILKKAGVERADLADSEYILFSEKDIKRLKRVLFLISLLPYKPQARDCDDFAAFAYAVARFFFGNAAFGIVWADGLGNTKGYHAANFYITEEREIKLYEPQNTNVYEFKPTGDRIRTTI